MNESTRRCELHTHTHKIHTHYSSSLQNVNINSLIESLMYIHLGISTLVVRSIDTVTRI